MKVVATTASKKLGVKLSEFHRIVEEGEVFEVSDERFAFLHGGNKFKACFVEKVHIVKPVEEEVKEEAPVEEVKVEEIPVVTEEAPVIEKVETHKEGATKVDVKKKKKKEDH